jgi:FAD/FMN-containing dehydrogenase
MSITSRASLSIPDVRAAVRGRVITPSDEDYDAQRRIAAGGVDPRPAAIVRVTDAADVAAVLAIVRSTGVPFAVRSGGHSGAAHGTIDDGIVIDVRDLDDLEIDAAGRTAWIGAGQTAGAVAAALAEHGLAVGFGDTGTVGVAGITLGGGIGYLLRKHGLTIDSLLEAELVTASGDVVRASASENPELFWAIRGGGGNFGVATRFRFRLHELPAFTGGMLVLPATADTIAGFIAAADAAPDELSTIANIMPAPPMPFLPESVHGRLVILGMIAWAGDAESGEQAIAPFRALADPLADMVAPGSYLQMFPPEDPDYHPTAVARTMFLDRVDRPVAETILQWLESSDATMRVAQLRVLGGAMARVPAEATAFAHRDSRILAALAAFYEGPDDRIVKEQWVEDFVTAVSQDDRGAYVNFVGDEGPERVRAAYPGATWDRLVEVKRRYDPDNLFRRNQNIPPTGA